MVAKEMKIRKNYVLSYFLTFLLCLGLYFKMDSWKERNIDTVGSIHLIVSYIYCSCYNEYFLLILKQWGFK